MFKIEQQVKIISNSFPVSHTGIHREIILLILGYPKTQNWTGYLISAFNLFSFNRIYSWINYYICSRVVFLAIEIYVCSICPITLNDKSRTKKKHSKKILRWSAFLWVHSFLKTDKSLKICNFERVNSTRNIKFCFCCIQKRNTNMRSSIKLLDQSID